jgi:hypothetical protein
VNAIGKLRALPPKDQRLLLSAWLLLLVIDLSLRLLPFSYVRRRAARSAAADAPLAAGPAPAATAHVAAIVAIAARHHLYEMGCLRRSLVTTRLLLRRGVAAVLCLGVRKDGETLQAHAWVEVGGQPIGEDGMLPEGFRLLDEVR